MVITYDVHCVEEEIVYYDEPYEVVEYTEVDGCEVKTTLIPIKKYEVQTKYHDVVREIEQPKLITHHAEVERVVEVKDESECHIPHTKVIEKVHKLADKVD